MKRNAKRNWQIVAGVLMGLSLSVEAYAGSCGVRGGKLWCGNEYNAPLEDKPSWGNPQSTTVNHMYTTYSWFKCWSTGELNNGGTYTWYKTIGDQNGSWGWMAANYLDTTFDFDSDPGRYGLPQCQFDWNDEACWGGLPAPGWCSP
jgi:hypothetical protein